VATSALATLWSAELPETAETIGTYVRLAAVLGQRTAELHAALAREAGISEVATDIIVDRAIASWERLPDALGHATVSDEATRAGLERLLSQHTITAARLRADRRALTPALPATATHGALDLAHVLLHEDNFMFIGFADDGSVPPDIRLRARNPIEDVVTLLRSIYAAGSVAAAMTIASAPQQVERLTGWSRWATACAATSLLQAYARTALNEPWWPGDAGALSALTRLFVVQQTSEEIPRVLVARPGWLSIMLGELTDIVGA
jgi:maltose alpha-D-glucosyltransferase/alpha-amylase